MEPVGALVADCVELAHPFGAHQGEIDRAPESHQGLVGADVGSGFLAADVLLAGLQGEDEGAASLRIGGLPDDAAGEFAHPLASAGHKAHVRAAVAKGYAEALAVSHCDVGAPFGGGLHHGECGRVAVFHKQGSHLVHQPGQALVAFHDAETVDGGHDNAGQVKRPFSDCLVHFGGLHEVDARVAGVGAERREHIGQQQRRSYHRVTLAGAGHAHTHSLGRSGRAVIHRGVGDVQARQGANHRLPLKYVAESTLRNLALVGSISCQELRTGSDVGNHRRGVVVVGALPDEHLEAGILRGEAFKPRTDFLLALCGRKLVLLFADEFRGHVGVELVKRGHPDTLQHHLNILRSMGEIGESSHFIQLFWRRRQNP